MLFVLLQYFVRFWSSPPTGSWSYEVSKLSAASDEIRGYEAGRGWWGWWTSNGNVWVGVASGREGWGQGWMSRFLGRSFWHGRWPGWSAVCLWSVSNYSGRQGSDSEAVPRQTIAACPPLAPRHVTTPAVSPLFTRDRPTVPPVSLLTDAGDQFIASSELGASSLSICC